MLYCKCKQITKLLGFQVLMVANTKITAFWDVAICSFIGTDGCFEFLTAFITRVTSKLHTRTQVNIHKARQQ